MVFALFVGIFQLLEMLLEAPQVLFFLKGCGSVGGVFKEMFYPVFYPVFSVKVVQRFC